jgi:putative oxidoreductase
MHNTSFLRDALAPLVLRLTLATIFIYHGFDKVAGKDNDLGSKWASKAWEQQREPPPAALQFHISQFAVAWGELLGGIALALGLLTRLAAAGLIIIQLGAIYTVTFQKGFSFASGGGWEYNFALLGMCLALIVGGGGWLAVDRLRPRRHRTQAQKPATAGV